MLRITLIKYISKEIWAIFLTCLMVFIFIIMAARILNMTGLIVNYGAGFKDLLNLILSSIPTVVLYALPISCLMAVLLSFIRMASDNELVALHSSGISLYQLMPPVIVFSFVCFLFAGFLTMFGLPYGNRTFDSLKKNMKNSIESIIKERVFIDTKDFIFYINSFSLKDKIMKNVFIVVKREGEERTILAKEARLKHEGDKIFLEVTNYKAFVEDKAGGSRIAETQFSTKFPFEIDSLLEASKNGKIDPDSMYMQELSELINNSQEVDKIKNIAKIKFYEMFSLPVAILILGIVGAPLGAHIRAHGRTKGIIISLLLFLSYFIIFSTVEILCEGGIINPEIGTWLPTLFLLIMSVFLFARSEGN